MASKAAFDASFNVTEHVIPCQHIRGYPHAVKDPTAVLRLAVKQYVPASHANSTRPSITIIATHANGIAKETYEPLWEELNGRLKGLIKAIWIADCSHQGASGALNEGIQGDDPNWFDHSRDLLAMVNHFRDLIQPPIIGVAHSMGCAQLVQLSFMHPQLFQSLVLIEPVIQDTFPPGPNAALMTSLRPDRWDSFEDARTYFLKNKFYKSWDRRALEKYLQYGLRSMPTALYPNGPAEAVTLTTPKAQEAWSYLRSTFSSRPPDDQLDDKERMITSDLTATQAKYLFHRAEAGLALQLLPYLQPSVKWIFGSRSYINTPADREAKVLRTGAAARGSGGVSATLINGAGHLIAQENIAETADAIAPYIEEQLEQYVKRKAFWDTYDSGKSDHNKLSLSDRWIEGVRQKSDTQACLWKGEVMSSSMR